MTVAALLTLSLILPALAPAQQDVAADIREAASQRAWIREYLRLYDELLSMQAAVGGITGEQADAQLAAAGRELHEQGFYDQDMDALVAQLRAAAGDFLASIEYEVANSTAWPSDLPAESYRSLSTRMLSYVRSELERALARGADPAAALRGATLVLAFTRGHAILPPELDFFAGVTDRAAGAMPGIELMPIEGGRPPSVAAPGPRINPTVPVVPTGGGAGGGAGRPGTPIRVILRGGTVEGSARLIGRGSTDLVGRTTRPRGDGQPDTEIELRLLAPGFVVEAIEVRHDASGEGGFVGRVADRLRRTWSTRAGTESPVVGVVSNRNLLNRANGRLDGITLVELSELDLFIQDDGQLEASATPATVTVIFRGGEQATFPILSGAAGPVLTGGGRTTPTGGGQAPPVIVSGIPPRTPGRPPTVTPPTGMPPITVPAGGGVTPGDANTTWGTNATSRRGQGGQLFSYACPRGGSAGSVWGTDVYTDDSSVCTAAVHAGLITFAGGGTVTIQIRPGQSGYAGSTRNGVQSATYPAWAGSFAFVGAGGAAPTTTTFAGSIQTGRASYAQGETITVTFAGFPGTNDWIALAPAGAAAESYGEWKWTDRRTSGTLTFTAPAPGSYELRVFLDWSNGGYNVRATRPFTVGAAAPTVRVGGFRAAQWIGMDRDVVSNGGSAAPDGSPDGQFVIQLRLDGVQQDRDMLIPLEVRSIALYSADAGGNPAGGHAWHTQNAGNWVLGVVHGGRQLNAGHVSTLGAFTGMQLAELFDLYAGNSGYFNPGQYFLIEVDAGGAQPLRQLVQIPASFVPPTGGQPPAGGGGVTPGATRTDWTTTATDHRAQIGQRFRYDCPPNGAAGRGPWGTDLYTDDSSVCTAAVHAGLITFASGGTVVIEMRANPGRYTGSARYGVQSADYGSWDHAFAFVGAGGAVPPPTTTFAGTIQTDRASYAAGETITVSFSGFPGTNDWIALAAAGAAAESYGEWHWTEQRTSGTMTFIAPAAGSYELRVFLDWSNGGYNVRATRPITVGAVAAAPVNLSAAWIGTDTDVVGDWGNGAPDGRPDGHFTLDLASGSTYEVRSIMLYISDAAGNRAGSDTWHSQNTSYWMVRVATGGQYLNTGHVPTLGSYQGSRQFHLFANSNNSFNDGQYFTVEVDVGLAQPLRQVVMVRGGAVPPTTTTFAGTIQTDRASYAAGETITVSFSGFPGTNDWIALAAAGAAAESYGEWHWTDQRTSGTMTFTAPAAGSYELRAFLDWSNGGYNVRATRPITVGGGVPQDIMVAYDAAWVGMDADAVSQGATAAPDGSADAHFSLFVDINMPYEIRYIAVYSSDDQGNPAGGQVWHTQNSGYWVLGVATQGTMLNAGHVASLGTHQGQRRFELFAGNSGYFNPGQNFVVEVDVGLSEPLRRVVVVSGGGAAAGGGAVAGGGAAAGGRNAALNRPTAQSSLSEWSHDNDAGGAVDGQKTGSYGFHTQNEPNPWWMVDLGGVIPLRQIRVFNRLDCCPERANTLQIYLSPDNTNWQLVYAHPGTPFGGSDGHPLVVDLRGHSGRYVMLRLAETTYLHLDEVEIDHDLP